MNANPLSPLTHQPGVPRLSLISSFNTLFNKTNLAEGLKMFPSSIDIWDLAGGDALSGVKPKWYASRVEMKRQRIVTSLINLIFIH